MDWKRSRERIAEETRLDGVYVVRTSLDAEAIGAEAAVMAYKSLTTVDIGIRAMQDWDANQSEGEKDTDLSVLD